MYKQLVLNLDEFHNESISTKYDVGGIRNKVIINAEDEKDFIKDATQQFKAKLKSSLRLEYVCGNCECGHEEDAEIYKCVICNKEICSECGHCSKNCDDELCWTC